MESNTPFYIGEMISLFFYGRNLKKFRNYIERNLEIIQYRSVIFYRKCNIEEEDDDDAKRGYQGSVDGCAVWRERAMARMSSTMSS